MFNRILVFGYGNMASAMVEGWLTAGVEPGIFTIYNPRSKDSPDGIELVTDLPSGPFDAILLGVKPQMLADVAPKLEPLARGDTVLLSLLAGVELQSLADRFSRAGGIVRWVPNLACALNKSPNALVASDLNASERQAVTTLAEHLGGAEWFKDEGMIDLLTALVGSGPGFVYRFIDALADGAASLGVEPEQAERLAVQMVEGAAALAAASPHSPGELADRVASPGGTTEAGMAVLDKDNALSDLVRDCLRSARNRGRELAAEAREEG